MTTPPWQLRSQFLGCSYAPSAARPLALFRMGWALAMLVATGNEWGRAPLYAASRYHLPLLSWFAPPSVPTFRALMLLAAGAALMALLGAMTRLSIVVVTTVHGYLFACDLLQFRNHIYLGLLFGALLAASPSGRALSLDAVARKALGRAQAPARLMLGPQLIKLQVLIVYGWSVLNKLRPSFLSGWTLQEELPFALPHSPLKPFLYDVHGVLSPTVVAWISNDHAMAVAAWAVLGAEAFLVVGLLSPRLRPYAALVGVALHGTIFLLMSVLSFGLLMVATYPLFLWPRAETESLAQAIERQAPG